MKQIVFNSYVEWLDARKGKVTGTRLKGLINKSDVTVSALNDKLKSLGIAVEKGLKKEDLVALLPKKDYFDLKLELARKAEKTKTFFELCSEKLSISPEDCDGYVPNETPMQWGSRTQKYALDRFAKETGLPVKEELMMWVRDDVQDIAVSPDGMVDEAHAVETKCLSSSKHFEAWYTKQIPDEYELQALQYFCINDNLKKLSFVFYDPRMPAIQYFVMEVNRGDIQDDIGFYLAYQKEVLAEVDEIVAKLTDF